MNEIDLKSMNTLEYPKIINHVSEFAVSDIGRQKIKEILPSNARDEVETMLEETDDAVKILRIKGGIPLGTFADVRPHIKRMRIGADLTGQEMVQVGQLLKGIREIYTFFEGLKEEDIKLQRLYALNDRVILLNPLERKIYTTLSESGVVHDDASPKLKSIRTSIRQNEARIREKLNNIVRGSQSKHLTDSIITMRNDRFVIPAKAESRNVFGGVVHDQSSSGQTLFIEPQSVLDLNNRLKQLESEEKYEIERILAELSAEIVPHSSEILNNLEILVEFDVLQAKALYARSIDANRPEVHDHNYIQLYGARHPLIPADEVVENDIKLGDNFKTVVVTGPNTGGKTVILKTLGLLQLMGQSGLYLPVEIESTIGVFNHVLSDIGDEQSIEQSLSTFSSHLTNIVAVLELADENSLILFDELGAGTDPQEGAALAIAILDHIGSIGSLAMITSHYPELKLYGYNRPETVNASLEFDIDTLKPTYKFKLGIPGRSNAFEIARRLGLNTDIIDTARELMTSESQNVDEMIRDLDAKQKETEKESAELRRKLTDAEKLHRQLKQQFEKYQKEKEHLKEQAQEEANQIVADTQKKADRIIDELRQKQIEGQTGEVIKEHEFIDAKSQLSGLYQGKEGLQKNKVLQREKDKKKLKVGQTVTVESLGQTGTLVEKEDNEWVVQLGMMKMKLPEEQLTVSGSADKEPAPSGTSYSGSASSVRPELDLRGERVEAGLSKLSQYLDQALLANYNKVTIIHGHGTGAMRKAVQDALRKHHRVNKFETAPANQGGTGATIVTLK
jgi:DNA mismatch repair protein MutS2